jgi:anti-sigma factor RsiW
MARCRTVQSNLTAWVDGELSRRWERKVRDHLERCQLCAAEAEALRSAVEVQTRVLRQGLHQAGVVPAGLWTRVAAHAQETHAAPLAWLFWLRPVVIVCAVVVLSLVGFVSAAGGPQAVLIPLGVKAPPPAVKRAPSMFTQYRMIEKLEILENFDTVDAVPLDDNDAAKG